MTDDRGLAALAERLHDWAGPVHLAVDFDTWDEEEDGPAPFCDGPGFHLDDARFLLGSSGRFSPDGGLDAAWAEVEAVLPEGWRLRVEREQEEFAVWQASAVSPAFFDGENDNDAECVIGNADTPAAALRALAASLATPKEEQG